MRRAFWTPIQNMVLIITQRTRLRMATGLVIAARETRMTGHRRSWALSFHAAKQDAVSKSKEQREGSTGLTFVALIFKRVEEGNQHVYDDDEVGGDCAPQGDVTAEPVQTLVLCKDGGQ